MLVSVRPGDGPFAPRSNAGAFFLEPDMADLIHRYTQQLVQGVNKEEFLAGVHDAIDWIEHKAEEAVDAVEHLFTPELASSMPAVETVTYADGVSVTGVAPLPEQSPEAHADEAPAVEVPAEAAAIAADPEHAE